jgi:hypothetical protein
MIDVHVEPMISASKILAGMNQAGSVLAGLGVDDLGQLPAEQFSELMANVHEDVKPFCELRREVALAGAQLQASPDTALTTSARRWRFDEQTVCRVIGSPTEQVVEFCVGRMQTLKKIKKGECATDTTTR